jgi:hypothetical protein
MAEDCADSLDNGKKEDEALGQDMYDLIASGTDVRSAVHAWRDKMGAAAGRVELPDLGIWGEMNAEPARGKGSLRFHTKFRL